MNYSVVIVAAGSGTRMGLGYNKVYAKLQDGEYIIEKSIHTFLQDEDCKQVVIVTDPLTYRNKIQKRVVGKIVLCTGGKTRQESVYHGLEAVLEDVVFIHDGARPYVSLENIQSLKNAMETEQAAILGIPCKDTIKKAVDGYIVETYDRSLLIAAQTPQVFNTELLIDCYEAAMKDGYLGTDDASLVEKYSSQKIKVVTGSEENIKITTKNDLRM